MSIASSINKNLYLGNGATATYNYTFKIFQAQDLSVIVQDLDGLATVLTDVDYTITGVNNRNGGTITLVGPRDYLDEDGFLINGFTLSLRRNLEIIQETDIRNQGDFFPEVHEDFFDRITMIAQQLDEGLNRSLKIPETVSGFNVEIPSEINGAIGRTIITNQTGNGFVVGPSADQVSSANQASIDAQLARDVARDWAIKTDDLVQTIDYSSKEYAIGVQRRGLAGGSSSKDWAILTGETVDDTELSSKEYATGVFRRGQAGGGSAKDWASLLGQTVDNTDFSAKQYALNAQQTATDFQQDVQDFLDQLAMQSDIQFELADQLLLGVGDDVTTTFPLVNTYNGTSIAFTINGLLIKPSEYMIVGTDIVLAAPLAIGQELESVYFKSVQNDEFGFELLSGVVDGVNKTFTYSGTPKDIDGFYVFVNGFFVYKYFYTNNLGTKTIVLDDAPALTQYVLAIYTKGSTLSQGKQFHLGFGNGVKQRFGPVGIKGLNKGSYWVYINGVKYKKTDFEIFNELYIDLDFVPAIAQEVTVIIFFVTRDGGQFLEYRTLTAAENTARQLRLQSVPYAPDLVQVDHQDASFLIYGVDFTFTDDKLNLLSTARANAVTTGEILRIIYKV